MNNEQELPQRKSPRLSNYDYAHAGAYFLTICTHNRQNVLSMIVGEGSPLPVLSQYGEIVEKWIHKITDQYPETLVDRYVIMPNHIHLLLSVIKDDKPITAGGRGDPSPTVDKIIGWLKYQSTKEINTLRGTTGEKLFQRSFYDHVVRNREDYDEIVKYICNNPLNWQLDQLNTDKQK